MSHRSALLREAGYNVIETDSLNDALRLAMSDAIDVLLICHSVSKQEQRRLTLFVRSQRRLMPIFCIIPNNFALSADESFSTRNGPIRLVQAVREAIENYSAADAEADAQQAA